MKLAERIEIVRAHTVKVLQAAAERYNMDTSKVVIKFDLRGRSAGMAGYHRDGKGYKGGFYVRFNVDMIAGNSFNYIMENTVPHEVAHIVCFMNPKLGKDHNQGWRWVCRSLGGTGQTYHTQEVVYAKGTTYTYITSLGHKINLSQQRHHKIQKGHTYTVRGRGQLNKDCKWHRYNAAAAEAVNTVVTAPVIPPAPKAPVVNIPTPANSNATKADKVRAMIGAAKKAGCGQDVVITKAVETLGMTKSLAKSYVKNNWDKV